MMKWNTTPTDDHDSRATDDLDDVQTTLETLDTVLAEHDANAILNDSRIKKHGLSFCEKGKTLQGFEKVGSFELEKQSLDILDSILAEYEDDICCDTKDNGNADSSQSHLKCDNLRSSTPDISSSINSAEGGGDELEDKCDNKDTSSPQLQRLRKTPPPPVPKRSPTTCLSTSSSFECPFPEAELDNSNQEKSSPPTPNIPEDIESQDQNTTTTRRQLSKKRGKLSSQPVEKGARPFLRSLSATQLDESDDDDDVFNENEEVAQVAEHNGADTVDDESSMASRTKLNDGRSPTSSLGHSKKVDTAEKFALIRFLLRTGQLEGLDEKPPTFKAPPPPTKRHLTQAVSSQCTEDVNKNEIPVNGSKEEFLPHKTTAPHITSVKIGEANWPEKPVAPGETTGPQAVSLITIQPKNSSPDLRKPLSTFVRDHSRSPSQEDAPRVRASENLATPPPSVALPLELKNPAAANKGAVFFNVYQYDGSQNSNASTTPSPKEQPQVNVKKCVKQKKVKNKKKSKDNAAEEGDPCKNHSDAANDLISELTDKIQNKKSASVGSADDDSDEEATDESQQKMNAKEMKTEKGIWKGFWRRKQGTEN